ncbi:N-6 DNA methylase (plasmid) [Borrelia coriaceae]|uniref:site-specific DNA-methyltransferase (adenine-specific) n=1 Tax=Borrelia coriaceae ATCC 43381 TaxID=1408429 RepID=W5SXU6_9SPIR|nr:type ISP restriction/modification enzyme [Borrelia coriaceae]AHH11707.1 Adenine-specific methyltransferase [Borrelia coriaceae ATCC 43381]UPA17340.1 N-6 DNA methylase [Borrelia coriaceae]
MNNKESLFEEYIASLEKTSIVDKTEHTDRSYLQYLLKNFINNPSITIQHEPRRSKEGFGSPDYIVKTNESIIGYIEVKKIEKNLDDTLKSPQIEKYKELSSNIILTNYIEFVLIRNKEVIEREILITKEELEKPYLKLDSTKVNKVINTLNRFFESIPQRIKNIEDLASFLSYRTKALKELIEKNLELSMSFNKINTLVATYNVLKENIYSSNFTINEFSDSISQTITYGLFIARLNNKNSEKIDFYNIKKFIPSNFSLIRDILKLIDDIETNNEYNSLKWILEEIINVVNNIDSELIFEEFSFTSSCLNSKDPYLYFYEDFLSKYDDDLRKAKGVYYTSYSVVSFITRSLHETLKTKFNFERGLANRDKVTVLDFATGTGTFLLEVIKEILKEIKKESGKQEYYINTHILKNIYGFEYLMTPYAVTHLKLSQYLKEVFNVDFNNKDNKLQVFLTNTLDITTIPDQKSFTGLFPAISEENELTNEVKRKPILVILGNPPYSSESKNNNEYILNLVKEYKQIKNMPLNEKNHKPLNDDYVKFIRFAEHKFEKPEEGLIGIITNNGYLDNITFRGMRYHLLSTFDEIYILNLHGNLRKKEKTDDNKIDENIFDIQTGVAIAIFAKYKDELKKNQLAHIYYKSIRGKREEKYNFLDRNNIFSIDFEKLEYCPPNYFFIKKDSSNADIYSKGISLIDIFIEKNSGIKTKKDRIAIDYTEKELLKKLNNFAYLSEQDARIKYDIKKDSMFWKLTEVQEFLKTTNINPSYIKEISYRPFDSRFTYYSKNPGVVIEPRYKLMRHLLEIENNIGLITTRLLSSNNFCHALITFKISDMCIVSNRTKESSYVFPLYVKEDQGVFKDIVKENFKTTFRAFINTKYGKKFTPEEILSYIYAVLYSSTYRTRFVEFLKIDFPQIIFVDNIEIFLKLSDLGKRLIDAHLLKYTSKLNSNIGVHIIDLNQNPNKVIANILYKEEVNELYYNDTSKLINIPIEVYEYTIGSYQVLKSYLKYRKGRILGINEIEHLEKVAKVIHFTINIQREIDSIVLSLKEFN